jgi:hypothetical protein
MIMNRVLQFMRDWFEPFDPADYFASVAADSPMLALMLCVG